MSRGFTSLDGQVLGPSGRIVASYEHGPEGSRKAMEHAARLNTEERAEKCSHRERCDADRIARPESLSGKEGLELCRNHREWVVAWGGKP